MGDGWVTACAWLANGVANRASVNESLYNRQSAPNTAVAGESLLQSTFDGTFVDASPDGDPPDAEKQLREQGFGLF